MEYVEFAGDNLAWLLMCLAVSTSALYPVHFLSSELLVASCDAMSAMLAPVRLTHSDWAQIRVDLPSFALVSVEGTSGDELTIRVLLVNSTLRITAIATERINGSLYVRSQRGG
jgi:hypothetical protein